jgi:3-methyladenine DNA glycosylase AlkD
MTPGEALEQLGKLGNEKVRALNIRNGAGQNQFGVKLGDIRALAKAIGPNHELALSLWETGNLDARLLATLLMKPKSLSAEALEKMVRVPRGSISRRCSIASRPRWEAPIRWCSGP